MSDDPLTVADLLPRMAVVIFIQTSGQWEALAMGAQPIQYGRGKSPQEAMTKALEFVPSSPRRKEIT